ncbi:XkdX family protein [Enterococcus faecalis]|uniref:XkdX family protein n=1 Tax=Enterococcus faecalis TaxID=1351 RepID=UPI000A34E12F|nr:XkdX family protein [Enterococcus faecalis]
MDKIKIWITMDENQMLTDYSLTAKENYIEIEVTEEPRDYLNWGLRNGELIHYPDDLNDLTNQSETSFEGNTLLAFAYLSHKFSNISNLTDVNLDYPKYPDILTVYNNQGMTNLDLKKMVEYQRISKEEYEEITGTPLEEGE